MCFGKKRIYFLIDDIVNLSDRILLLRLCSSTSRCTKVQSLGICRSFIYTSSIIDGSSHMHHMRVLHNTINAAINCTGLLQPKKDKKLRRRCCKIRINELCSFANKNIIRKYCFFHSQYLSFFMCWQEKAHTQMRAMQRGWLTSNTPKIMSSIKV